MVTNISHSPAETQALGETWGRTVAPGLVIALQGDLGAGKTQLVKGLARGLDISARVQSPTFALVNSYPGGRLPLFHLDLYRLDTPEMVLAAGLEEYLRPEGITVIEWADRWFGKAQDFCQTARQHLPGAIPVEGRTALRWVQIELIGQFDRRISYEDFSV